MNDFELQLQRLVDGQLDRVQIQTLLKQIDQEDLWRDIAAAFVEDQIWQSEINAGTNDAAENVSNATNFPSSTAAVTTQPDHRSLKAGGVKFWLSLAAAILAGVWLGQAWNISETDNGNPGNTIASNQPTTSSTDNLGPVPPTQLADRLLPAHRLSMGDAGEVPLFTLDQARQIGLLKETAVPQETVDQFREQGYQLEQNTRYISGQAQDGRRILVPIRSVRVNPGN